MPKVYFFRFGLRIGICDHLLCRYVLHVHFLLWHHVFHKIVFDIYVFGFDMELRVFCISYCSLTITIDKHKLIASPLLIKCSKNPLNQTPSCTMTNNDTNSTSIVDRAIQDCFLLFHDMAKLLSKKANPEVDFLSFKSPP